ncbi:MAG: rRNA maturation RNase YbeY [Fidelibacterota bacterium]
MIHISVEIDSTFRITISDETIKKAIHHVFDNEQISSGNVTVIFTSDESLRAMKNQYFNIDAYTDVITFNLEERGEPIDGEIYISPERASENSIAFGETFDSEMTRLIIHGTLHLIGYDDQLPDDLIKMKEREERYLAEVYQPVSPE